MKDHFIKLFNYDKYVNQKIAEAIVAQNGPEKPLGLMAHLLTAEKVWLRRISGERTISVVLWPVWQADELELVINETYASWLLYLETVTEDELQKLITYVNFQGNEFTMRVIDIITHVINHGTHTRAQAGVHLRLAGAEQLPVSDYSYYVTTIL